MATLCAAKLVSFKEAMDFSEGSWFVMYYAPWCGHCKTLKPSFMQVAPLTSTNLVLVDCEIYEKHCTKAGVKKFPTLIYYSEDFQHQYNRGRTAKDLKDFLSKVNSPAYSNVTEIVPAHDTSFVLHYNPSYRRVFTIFSEVAKEKWPSPSYFYAVEDTSTYLAVEGIDAPLNYTLTELTASKLRQFVEVHALPTVVELDSNNFQSIRIQTQDKTLLLLAYDKSEASQAAIKVLSKVAADYRRELEGSIQACIINFEIDSKQLEIYDIKTAPALLKVIIEGESKLYAKRSDDLDEAGMLELINRHEVIEISGSMWKTAQDLAYRVVTLQIVTDNLFVMGIIAAIVGVCMGIAYWDPDKSKTE